MVVPDYKLIVENILYSYGFLKAEILATKVAVLYKLASEQLSM